MKSSRWWHAASSLLFVGTLALGAASALAQDGDDDKGSGGFGRHPTLPVPEVLAFGVVAVTAAAIAARRRKPKGKAQSKGGGNN